MNLLLEKQNFQIQDGGSNIADLCIMQKSITPLFLYCSHFLGVIGVADNEPAMGKKNVQIQDGASNMEDLRLI